MSRFNLLGFIRFFFCEGLERKCILPVVLIFFFVSCSTQHISKTQVVETIEFEKTGCLNNCKSYKISVSSNGYSTYEGMSNVSKTGKYFRQLKKRENDKFWKIINKDSLLKMNEAYNYGDEDTQQHFLKYYSEGRLIKEIRFGPFPPPLLVLIDKKLDTISEKGRWKMCK